MHLHLGRRLVANVPGEKGSVPGLELPTAASIPVP